MAEDSSEGETAPSSVDSVTPAELYERVRAGDRVRIVDVRDRDEFDRWRISGAGAEAVQIPAMKFVQARATGSIPDLVADLRRRGGPAGDGGGGDGSVGGGASDDRDGEGADPVVVVCARGEASVDAAADLRGAGVEAVNLAGGMEGWARVYVADPIGGGESGARAADGATVLQYRRPSSGCLAYLVVSGGEAAVIDPLRVFAERYVADAAERGATIRYAVDTHVHADHVSGIRDVAALSGAESVVPEGARDRGLAFDARLVEDGEELPVGDVALTARHAPGHTSEMTAFGLGDVLFGGDLLFQEGVARPDLERDEEGAAEMARRLHRTLRERVLALPDDTLVAPGHYGESTKPGEDGAYAARLGELRERLPALSADEDEFVERALADLPPRPANFEEIIETNLGRRGASDEEAFEWELGPNNCATSAGTD